jgi:hypothetical protein
MARRNAASSAAPPWLLLEANVFAILLPLILGLAPQLAGMIFGPKGADVTTKVTGVVQAVVGDSVDVSAPGGAAAAVTAIQADPKVSSELAAKLSDLHLQMQKEQDQEADQVRHDTIEELSTRLADTASARGMGVELAKAHSGLAYGGVVVSVVIVAGFVLTTYAVLTNHLSTSDGQFGSVLVGTLAAMATQVANYWLGSSIGSSTKNALLANAQNSLAVSVPASFARSNKGG